mgnify:CR=1 FL=1
MEKNNTAVIILNYNNYEDTINCIESVERFNTSPIKYIIIDNGSTREGTIEAIDHYLSKKFNERYCCGNEDEFNGELSYVTFVVSATNDGYARGNNKGLNIAYNDSTIDSILILNNDVLFAADIIPYLRESYYNRLKDVAILSPILYKKNLLGLDYNCARNNIKITNLIRDNILHYYYAIRKFSAMQIHPDRYLLLHGIPHEEYLGIELPSGSCMFIDKLLFKSIGSFDPNTFLYWEENILFKKIESINKKNYLCTKCKCIHLGASSTTKSSSIFIVNCSINSMLYYAKVYSGCTNMQFFLLKLSSNIFKILFNIQIFFKKALGRSSK